MFNAKQLNKTGIYPFPVVEVHLTSGAIRRYSFWAPANKPHLAEAIGRKCAEAFWKPEYITKLQFENIPFYIKRNKTNWKDIAKDLAIALKRHDPQAPELESYSDRIALP